MWAGDQNVDFSYGDGLPSTVPAALNMGLSGIGVTHIDVGGYTTAAQFKQMGVALQRTEELLLRSAEAAIFSPMFRSHEGWCRGLDWGRGSLLWCTKEVESLFFCSSKTSLCSSTKFRARAHTFLV